MTKTLKYEIILLELNVDLTSERTNEMKTPLNNQITKVTKEINEAIKLAEKQHDWQTLSILGQIKETLAQTKEKTIESNILAFGNSNIFS